MAETNANAKTKTMAGKTCLVTGATSGIGEVAATELAGQGARVVIVGRSRERCEATVERIRQAHPGAEVESLVADLSSQAEVRRLAGEIQARCPRLDVLVNNAGALFSTRKESADGIEMTLALNHLGYFLLTNLLLDTLRATPEARVVNVASDAHTMARRGINFDDIQGRKRYGGMRAYAQSKLANILFTQELARRLEGTGVAANSLHPGFVATNFGQGNGWVNTAIKLIAPVFAIKPDGGARTTVYLASSPEVEGLTGKYFVKCRSIEPASPARDVEAARRLWQLSEELTAPR